MFFGKPLAPHPHHQNIHTQKRLSSCLRLVDPPLNYRGASLGSHGVDVVEGEDHAEKLSTAPGLWSDSGEGCACVDQPELPFPNNKQRVVDPIMDLRGGDS